MNVILIIFMVVVGLFFLFEVYSLIKLIIDKRKQNAKKKHTNNVKKEGE